MNITGKIERGWRENQIQIIQTPKIIMKEERINILKVMVTKDKDILLMKGRNMMTMKSEKIIEMSTIQEKMKRDIKEGKIIKGETM